VKVGVLRSGGLVAVEGDRAVELASPDLGAFLAGGAETAAAAREAIGRAEGEAALRPDGLRFAAPYVSGAKIVCHVVNYDGHATAVGAPPRPYFFLRPATSVLGDGDPIEAHAQMSRELDWETELAFVIGQVARDVREEDAYDHVAGFTILNDVSHREYQFNKHSPELRARYGLNWLQGKGLDASCPIGPVVVLRDELPDPYPLRLRTWVNGELRQDASTADMVHRLPALLAELSRGLTLNPGDIVATGSPPGAAMDDETVPYLAAGDVVRSEIERIGVLENPVVD
jgi:2-keto-4-pentenoate hydratase/2-oxohepta-3-ene-1,7-dioic acid hydratase in catechol pathway